MNYRKLVDRILECLNQNICVCYESPLVTHGPIALPIKDIGDVIVLLPLDILSSIGEYTIQYTCEILRKKGIETTDKNVTAFIILHEFGHVINFRTQYQCDFAAHDIARLASKRMELDKYSKYMSDKYTLDERLAAHERQEPDDMRARIRMHWSLPIEVPAHRYALRHIKKVVAAIQDIEIL